MLWARWAQWMADSELGKPGGKEEVLQAGRMPCELVSARGSEVKGPRTSRLQAGSSLQLLVGNRWLALQALQGRAM